MNVLSMEGQLFRYSSVNSGHTRAEVKSSRRKLSSHAFSGNPARFIHSNLTYLRPSLETAPFVEAWVGQVCDPPSSGAHKGETVTEPRPEGAVFSVIRRSLFEMIHHDGLDR